MKTPGLGQLPKGIGKHRNQSVKAKSNGLFGGLFLQLRNGLKTGDTGLLKFAVTRLEPAFSDEQTDTRRNGLLKTSGPVPEKQQSVHPFFFQSPEEPASFKTRDRSGATERPAGPEELKTGPVFPGVPEELKTGPVFPGVPEELKTGPVFLSVSEAKATVQETWNGRFSRDLPGRPVGPEATAPQIPRFSSEETISGSQSETPANGASSNDTQGFTRNVRTGEAKWSPKVTTAAQTDVSRVPADRPQREQSRIGIPGLQGNSSVPPEDVLTSEQTKRNAFPGNGLSQTGGVQHTQAGSALEMETPVKSSAGTVAENPVARLNGLGESVKIAFEASTGTPEPEVSPFMPKAGNRLTGRPEHGNNKPPVAAPIQQDNSGARQRTGAQLHPSAGSRHPDELQFSASDLPDNKRLSAAARAEAGRHAVTRKGSEEGAGSKLVFSTAQVVEEAANPGNVVSTTPSTTAETVLQADLRQQNTNSRQRKSAKKAQPSKPVAASGETGINSQGVAEVHETNLPRHLLNSIRQVLHLYRQARNQRSVMSSFRVNAGKLGTLEINISEQESSYRIAILVESESARSLLGRNMLELQDALAESGMDLSSITVDVGSFTHENGPGDTSGKDRSDNRPVKLPADQEETEPAGRRPKLDGKNTMEIYA